MLQSSLRRSQSTPATESLIALLYEAQLPAACPRQMSADVFTMGFLEKIAGCEKWLKMKTTCTEKECSSQNCLQHAEHAVRRQ